MDGSKDEFGIAPRVSPPTGSSAGGAVLPDTSVAVRTDADEEQNRESGNAEVSDVPPATSSAFDALAASRISPMGGFAPSPVMSSHG